MELSQTGDSGERPWVREPWSSSSGLDVKEQGTGESDCLLLKTGSILREVTTYSCAGCALHKAPSEGEIRSGICLRGQVIHRWDDTVQRKGHLSSAQTLLSGQAKPPPRGGPHL